MKKIILCIILISIIFIITGCKSNNSITIMDMSELRTPRQGMIIMPNGSIITGTCTHFGRYSDDWCYVKIDDTNYYVNQWRVILWEK